MRFFVLIAWLLSFGSLMAQKAKCDVVLLKGDTTVCQTLNSKGKIKKEDFYLGNKRLFTRTWTYAENGSYQWEQRISKGWFVKKNGPAMYFFPNGRLFYKTYYRHDQKVGPCVSYYESGIVAQTCSLHLKNGKRDGLFNSYYSNGNVLTKQLWRNGRLQKIFTYRDESGQELPIGDFKDGNGSWLLQKDGKVVYVLTYKNGKLIQEGSAGSFVPFSQR